MENNKFPPPEPEKHLPESLSEASEQMEPPEEVTFTELFPEESPVPEAPEEDDSSEMPEVEELLFADLPEEAPCDPSSLSELPEETQCDPSSVPDFAEEAPIGSLPEVQEPAEPSDPEIQPCEPEILPEQEETFDSEPFSEVPIPMEAPSPETTEADSGELPAEPQEAMDFIDPVIPHPQPPEPEEEEEDLLDQDYRDEDQDFDTMFQAPASQSPQKKQEESVFSNKGRPKRKKGEGLLGIPSILSTFVWLALILVIGVTAGRMLWLCAADVLAFGREDKVVTVTIYEADTMEDIIDKLHEQGLIRYKSLFTLYADISEAEEDIKPGIYDLNTRYDYHALVNFMSPRSSREVIQLTIPEGYTCRQIFSLLEENRICTAVDAASYAANGALSEYWFLEGVQRGTDNCLEGYLFPDTYEFYKNSTPKEALERMLDNFEHRFNEELMAQIEAINNKFGCDYTVREIVIIASLIEKESAAPGESPMVSGVIYNRLFDWGNNPPYLNIDASIVYAQGGENERIDTSLDSPYNTYAYEGLTPGPIANPGLSSLKAALNPEDHNYYYYVLNPSTGMHQFSTTYEEHTGYVRQFAQATEGQ